MLGIIDARNFYLCVYPTCIHSFDMYMFTCIFRSFEVYGYGVSSCPRYLMANGILSTLQNLHPALVLEEVSLSVLHDMLTTTLMDILKMAASLKVVSLQS